MKMTREQFAEMLNGREYCKEMSHEDGCRALDSRLVVVFGASDDLVEFRGSLHDGAGGYGGGDVLVHRSGVVQESIDSHNCDCEFCGFGLLANACAVITAKWDSNGYSWFLDTKLDHSTFDILEDGEKYCRGLVIDLESLPVVGIAD